jgi:serine phosphatase RsbU (regulator of sigma subunit)
MSQALVHLPAAMLVTAVFDALAEHAGAPSFPDDASVLVAKRRAS